MDMINEEDFKKLSNKTAILFIFQIISLMIIIPILSKIGIYNHSNGFIFNMAILLITACLLFPYNFKGMFLRKNKINILEGFLYIFLFFTIYWPLSIVIINLFSPIYSVNINLGEISLLVIILQGIIIPIVEEIVYRGILLESLRKYGDVFALVISALFFGMMHGSRIGHSFLAGIFTGLLYIKSKNIVYSISMHIINNLLFPSFASWLESTFNIYNVNIAFLIIFVICMMLTAILYFLAKSKNSQEVEKIKSFKIKNIFQNISQDKGKYKAFFEEGGVIFSLVVYFIVLSAEINMIFSKLK